MYLFGTLVRVRERERDLLLVDIYLQCNITQRNESYFHIFIHDENIQNIKVYISNLYNLDDLHKIINNTKNTV